jgi:glutamyl/glutaminyl-tRNA synthetase
MPLESALSISITEYCYECLSSLSELTHEIVTSCLGDVKETFAHLPPTKVMMTLRLALTDTKVGASLVDTAVLLGKEECMKRLRLALRSMQLKLKRN